MEANRKNAKKSTGPKDTSHSCLNALKHGLLGKEILLCDEKFNELKNLGDEIRKGLAPATAMENLLVERIVSSTWRLKRAVKIESRYLNAEYESSMAGDYYSDDRTESEVWQHIVHEEQGDLKAWQNLLRYETTLERQIYKALNELMRLQAIRLGADSVCET